MTESERNEMDTRPGTSMNEASAKRLGDLLRDSSPGFDSGFADRVMGRLHAEQVAEQDLALVMRRQFRRWAPLGLAAGMALAAFNVSLATDSGQQSAVEALLGLEPVSLTYAYSIEVPGMTETGAER